MLGLDDIGFDPALGERLPLADYRKDFRERQWTIDGQDSWKLERQQEFQEPGFASWEAFNQGDWAEALRLIEEERTYLREFSEENRRRGVTLYRVRVVEEPIAPYLQWELQLLRLRAEYGERIRVIGPERLAALEQDKPLPELLTLGDHVVYQILYNRHGILDGAVRFASRDVTFRCRKFVLSLYEAGEEISSFFDRKVSHLPPPRPE